MQIVCPNCQTRFSFNETGIADPGVKLRCGKCKTVFRLMRKGGEVATFVDNIKRSKLFVANESAAFCAAVQKVLSGEPFEVIAFNDGLEAMKAIEAERPAAVLLDVALPSMYGFEICEAVRRNKALDNVKLILVASIYDKTKYKRTPSSLYGADAYIEKHHIPDSLSALVKKLVIGKRHDGQLSPDLTAKALPAFVRDERAHRVLEGEETARKELRQDEELKTTISIASEELSEASVKARRLARIIVSDILLYNQDKVMEGVRNGSFYELLKDEIMEGKSFYARRVPTEVAEGTTFLDDAFEQLISSKLNEMVI